MTVLIIIVAIMVMGCSILLYYIVCNIKRKQQLPFPEIPYCVPDPHWFFGHLSLLGHDVRQGHYRVAVQYAGGKHGISTFYTLNTPVFSVLDAALVNRILKFTSNRRGNPTVVRHFKKMFGETTLLMINGKPWRNQRDLVQRCFHNTATLRKIQRSMIRASMRVEHAVCRTIERIEQQHRDDSNSNSNNVLTMDAVTLARMASLDVFGLSCLGYDFGCTVDAKLQQSDVFRQTGFLQTEATRRCYHDRMSLAAQCYWIPTPANRRHARELSSLKQTLNNIVRTRRMELRQRQQRQQQVNGSNGCPNHPTSHRQAQQLHHPHNRTNHNNDLLDSLLLATADGFVNAGDEFIGDWLITIIFGGYDTAAIALAYTIFLLAKHPEYQSECRKEATSVFGAAGADPTATTNDGEDDDDDTVIDPRRDLPFISACFLEALRYYPPAAVTARNLDRPMKLQVDVDGDDKKQKNKVITLPTGTRCFFSLYWIQHSEINFPRPDEYIPERWVRRTFRNGEDAIWIERRPDDDDDDDDRGCKDIPAGKRNAIVAFSAGARNCVGVPIATRMVPTILAILVRSFVFELVDPDYEIQLERSGGSQIPTGGIPIKITKRAVMRSS